MLEWNQEESILFECMKRMKHPNKKASEMSLKELASYIDYSVLKPEFTEDQIVELTKDGVELGCAIQIHGFSISA